MRGSPQYGNGGLNPMKNDNISSGYPANSEERPSNDVVSVNVGTIVSRESEIEQSQSYKRPPKIRSGRINSSPLKKLSGQIDESEEIKSQPEQIHSGSIDEEFKVR